MKNAMIVLVMLFFLGGCSSKKAVSDENKEPVIQYRDDFRAVSDKKKIEFLDEMNADKATASVLILTKGFKGENVTVSNAKKVLYKGMVMSHPETGIAQTIKIDNTTDTKLFDRFSKKEAEIKAENAKKYKFIYLMKDHSQKGNPFTITYSNTLRPLK
jgi:hypothetical protein